MKPVVVIRPQPGCDRTAQAARSLGLTAHAAPLFAIEPMPWEPPPPDRFDALLIGSANALRHGGTALAAYRGKPAFVVGDATAAAAREAGMQVAGIGTGGLQSVLEMLEPHHRQLLRLAGKERIALNLPAGIGLTEKVVYGAEPLAMPQGLIAILSQSALVLLHSAAAARHLGSECALASLDRRMIGLACIGPRVAEAAGEGWGQVDSASEPNDKALLALACELCQ